MTPSLNNVKRRTRIMIIAVLVCFIALIARLGYWQLFRGAEMSETVQRQQQSTSAVTTSRGKIYDRNGKVLAESASSKNLVCNPVDIEEDGNAELISSKLSEILDMDEDKIYKLITTNARYVSIKRQLSAEEISAVEELMDGGGDTEVAKAYTGLYFEDGTKRYYQYGVAATVLGVLNSDGNGISGIEGAFNSELLGESGGVTSNRSANGGTLKEQEAEYLTAAQSGNDVVLTIDENIQYFLESLLEEAVEENNLKEGAAGIVMNPKTGEILAMSTKPDFDSNNPYDVDAFCQYLMEYDEDLAETLSAGSESSPETSEGTDNDDGEDEEDEEDEEEFSTDSLSDEQIAMLRNKMWRNKAISDSYEPGSTFKIITAAAALEEHIVDENSTFYCPGYKIVADRKISCANTNGHGAENFVEGVQNSCNPVYMELGIKLGSDKYKEYFNAFGLGDTTGIELAGESSSISYTDDMSEVDLATSAFGQGIQVTPIQLITAVSAVINGGVLMKPHIVSEIRNDEGILASYEPEEVNRVISEETSAKMCEILESVVSSPDATGKNAYVKGCRIGGKTGTSEKMPRGTDARIASFIGFAPANDPQVVCLIMLDEPQVANRYGGTIAAPLAGELLEMTLEYLGIEKQYSEDEEPDVTIEVPDVRNDSVTSAQSELSDAGFTVKIKGSGDTVVDQLPQPGNILGENSTVILYTEETEEEDQLVTVPDVTGGTASYARDLLQAYNLNFEVTGAGHAEAYGSYAVKQSVEPGEQVRAGTVIGVEFRQVASD
ncbi:MAG: PASTA domain-containing protein [Firmicutes bacterium]|nr:PASTA domain-containing protein [Bacillota bacterium]